MTWFCYLLRDDVTSSWLWKRRNTAVAIMWEATVWLFSTNK